MPKRLTAAQLEERAKIARAREAARKADREANPKTYKPQVKEDYQDVYYRDPIEAGRILKFVVKKQAVTNFGGADDAGLLLAAAEGAVVTEVNKGSKIPYVKIKWYYGDDSVITVPETATHGRWIKKYDEKGGQSHWSMPFTVKEGAFTLNTILTKFNTYFNNNNGTKKAAVLGVRGYAELCIGYGNRWAILDTSK